MSSTELLKASWLIFVALRAVINTRKRPAYVQGRMDTAARNGDGCEPENSSSKWREKRGKREFTNCWVDKVEVDCGPCCLVRLPDMQRVSDSPVDSELTAHPLVA